MSSVTQPYQIGVNALGDIVPIWRYSSDVCECGHTWAEQPSENCRIKQILNLGHAPVTIFE